MAINPETTHEAEAEITTEQWESRGKKDHMVSRKRLPKDWQEWSKDNRLDSYWTRFPLKGKKGGKPPFQVGDEAVPSGSKKVTVKWKVWESSDQLHDKEVEFYSVMRAEKYYIDAGYKKLGSKYSFTLFGRPIEDCGVDNFFYRASDRSYVFCESKFTRSMATFASWKADKKRVWARLSNYKGQRQMSWKWIQDRAQKAYKRPSGLRPDMPLAEKAALRMAAARMKGAADQKNGKRMVNIHGADHVPVCPGVYTFTSDEAGVISSNELLVDWPFTPAEDEFIELGEEFDAWASKKNAGDEAPPAPGSGT
ncbi:hypothetical protein [Corallococcus llansteffanensis]|uniref:Uncharacterized protein n=1 Tax=Corallococcus llansteffanensis TaxID=2316731 RepID=A0A3A8PYK5_9BACT|nr:hypothetical protein [Corallococcus llansteffanensis]RKH59940.1 hypothetical protein D7V93_13980 [Corallococcus llansteffanensis]